MNTTMTGRQILNAHPRRHRGEAESLARLDRGPAAIKISHVHNLQTEKSTMSGRPRTPLAKAEISGATIKNPKRYRDRREPKPAGPIGRPPPGLTAAQADCWREFARELPWLNAGNRALVHSASVLRARLSEPDCPVSAVAALGVILSKLGATPADASRVSMPDTADDDPDEKYFRRPN